MNQAASLDVCSRSWLTLNLNVLFISLWSLILPFRLQLRDNGMHQLVDANSG